MGLEPECRCIARRATQHVTCVSVYAFMQNGSTYLHQKTYDITGWTDGTTFKRFAVPDADKLPVGVYKFLAVGRCTGILQECSSSA